MTHLPSLVLIFFNRPVELASVLEALEPVKYDFQRVFLVSDGPRDSTESEKVLRCRSLAEKVFENIDTTKLYSVENMGLAARVTSALDAVFVTESSAIILEDDCVPTESFFHFVSWGLYTFSRDKKKGIVSGNSLAPRLRDSKGPSYEIGRHPYIWGWGTWQSTWREFRSEPLAFWRNDHRAVKSAQSTFETFSGKMRLTTMLRRVPDGNSWALPFAIFIRSHNLKCIAPRVNLVDNIGMGQNSTNTRLFLPVLPASENTTLILPETLPKLDFDKSLERREEFGRALRFASYLLSNPAAFFDLVGAVMARLRTKLDKQNGGNQ